MQDPLDYLTPQTMWAGTGVEANTVGHQSIREELKSKKQIKREQTIQRMVDYFEWAQDKNYGVCSECSRNRKIHRGRCFRCLVRLDLI